MLSIAVIPIVAVVAVWTWQFINWVWLKPKKIERLLRKQGMRGSSYKFVVGDAMDVARMCQEAYSKPIGFKDDIAPRLMPHFVQNVQKYGNYSFSWAGPQIRILVNDVAVARNVLNNRLLFAKFFKSSNPILELLATGFANMEGEEWATGRLRVNPLFNMDKLKPMVPAIQVCCEDTVNQWKEMTSKEGGSCVVDVAKDLGFFTGAALTQLMFSFKYTEDIKKVFTELAELAALGRITSKIFTLPGEKYLPTKAYKRSREIDNHARATFTSMINDRLEKNRVAPNKNLDLLDIFMEDLYDQSGKTESERRAIVEYIVGECKIFFFAGFETSSNILSWLMVYLAMHQDWQVRAREEVFQELGNKKEITSDDLNKLKIMAMIVNEVFRLYPPVMEISRIANKETKLNGYTIPKDALVSFPILMFHRDPKIWGKDAGEFRPERFAEGVLKAANGEAAFMPFGWGPRICIGNNFAMLETKTFLATLLRNFSFEISPTYAHAPAVDVTVHPQYGAPIVLKKL